MALTWQWHGRKDSVTLPAVATFAAVIAVVAVLVLVRYVRLPSTRKLSSTVKNAGTGVRRSTRYGSAFKQDFFSACRCYATTSCYRERTKVDRWSPPRVGTPKSTKDSPSTKVSEACTSVRCPRYISTHKQQAYVPLLHCRGQQEHL